jgi:hypothetical protein
MHVVCKIFLKFPGKLGDFAWVFSTDHTD